MERISKRFPGVVALDSVAFHADRGEVVALVGENGAGKSTLMKVLAGLHHPDAGDIRIDGRTVSIHSPTHAARLGIAVIHQDPESIDTFDVAGNIFLGREPVWGGPLRLVNRRRLYKDTRSCLDRLGLDLSPRTPVAELSCAQQQLVAIARACSMDARVLVMDEPTSSLTLSDTERLFAVIRDLRAAGVAIVYISHRLGEIQDLADRVVVLRDGRNAGALQREEINREAMVRLMVGRDVKAAHREPAPAATHRGLEIEKVRTARYPGHEVSLAVRRGEILGIAGLVGAGRSELAEAISGVGRRLSGDVLVDGEPLAINSPADAIRHGIYLVPEDRRRLGLVTELTIRENITLPSLARYARAGLIDARAETDAATQASGALRVVAASIETKAGHLSGGNQQKVVLAKWLSMTPRVLLFDEPTKGIDVGARAEIHGLMRRLADEGAAVLMISSDMEEILATSDRVAVMHEGRVTGILERADCTPESIMRLAVA